MAAAYLAKYATKSIDAGGVLDYRLHGPLPVGVDLSEHLRRMVNVAWDLGSRDGLAELKLQAWAHSLCYRGHWLTKSAGWSHTFTARREGRRQWRLAQMGITTDQQMRRVGDWQVEGVGHLTTGDAWLAASANQMRREGRRAAWDER